MEASEVASLRLSQPPKKREAERRRKRTKGRLGGWPFFSSSCKVMLNAAGELLVLSSRDMMFCCFASGCLCRLYYIGAIVSIWIWGNLRNLSMFWAILSVVVGLGCSGFCTPVLRVEQNLMSPIGRCWTRQN